MALDLVSHLPTIITATVGAIGMYGAHRTASWASRKNAKETAELEAYKRAREMDIQTNDRLRADNRELFDENVKLRKIEREKNNEIDKLRTERIALVRELDRLRQEQRSQKDG